MSDLAPEAVAVVEAATRLVTSLEFGHPVLSDVQDLQQVLAALEVAEQHRYEQRLRDAIEHAAGLALTHEWLVGRSVNCTRCRVGAGSVALRRGAVPECDPADRCAPYAEGHFIPGTQCVYCKTEYPTTATPARGIDQPGVVA